MSIQIDSLIKYEVPMLISKTTSGGKKKQTKPIKDI